MDDRPVRIDDSKAARPDSAISLADLADVLGISLRSAQRFVQTGDFVAIGTAGKNKKMYALGACVKTYLEIVREDLTSKTHASRVEELQAEKLQAEIDLKQSQGELHQLKTQIAKGDYLRIDVVQSDYERYFVSFKKFAMAFPGRLSGIIAGYVDPAIARGIERDLQLEVNQMLRTFVVAGNQPSDGGAG